MIIENSNILLASSRSYIEKDEKSEHLEVWKGDRNQNQNQIQQKIVAAMDKASISHGAMNAFNRYKATSLDDELSAAPTEPIYLMKLLIEEMFGNKIKIGEIKQADANGEDAEALASEMADIAEGAEAPAQEGQPAPERVGWGRIYDYHESHYEYESTEFKAAGVVQTADGKTINFALDMKMEREYFTQTSISIREGDALTDPLVINFGGSAADLTDAKFSFDLDADGTSEDISFVTQGSGVLVFDRNRDGVANDGSELFGPTTGQGFAELATHDLDQNDWIDERDAAYDYLRVWTKDSSGADSLLTLKEANVGAIYLGSADTQFDVKDSQNNLQGRIQETGIYLTEEGRAMSIQQLDIAV